MFNLQQRIRSIICHYKIMCANTENQASLLCLYTHLDFVSLQPIVHYRRPRWRCDVLKISVEVRLITAACRSDGSHRSYTPLWVVNDPICLHSVVILSRVGLFVAHGLEQMVKGRRYNRSEEWSCEENPNFADVVIVDDRWAQGSCRVN